MPFRFGLMLQFFEPVQRAIVMLPSFGLSHAPFAQPEAPVHVFHAVHVGLPNDVNANPEMR